MKEMKIQCRVKKRTIHTTDSRHSFPRYPNLVRGLEIVRPDEVWVADTLFMKPSRASLQRMTKSELGAVSVGHRFF
jgi:hypothetical protein